MQLAKYNYTPNLKNVNRVFSASAAIVRKKGKNQDSPLLKNPGFYVLCCDWIFRFLRLFR